MPARQDAVRGATASTILEVAEGLRWRDPQLSAALAEHAVRLAGGDADVRGAAERSAILALGQLDRGADVVARALPQLRQAEQAGRSADAASLRCELAAAAVRCEDADLAEALLAPVAGGAVLPIAVRLDALTAWAGARALRGDVEGADAAADQARGLLAGDGGSDLLRQVDLHRIRASARRHRGDGASALEVLRNAPAAGDPSGEDGGRRAALLVADQVDLLLDLHRPSEARAAAAAVLSWTPEVATALPLGRLRCALAGRAHLPAGELDAAEALARAAERDLVPRGHDAQAAEALQVLAAVAEGRGDLARTADALRRAHVLALAAHDAVARTRIALTSALAAPTSASSAPAVPPVPTEPVGAPSPRRTRSSRRAAEQHAAEQHATEQHATEQHAAEQHAAEQHVAEQPEEQRAAGPSAGAPDTPTPDAPTREPAAPSAPRTGARHRGRAPDGERPQDVTARPEDGDTPAPERRDPTPATAPDAGTTTTPRRRGRYRADAAPDPLLAAALADGGFDAFSTAPAAADRAPEPVDTESAGPPAREDAAPDGRVVDEVDPLGLGARPLDGRTMSTNGHRHDGGPLDGATDHDAAAPEVRVPDITASDDGTPGESADDRRTRRARERWESAVSLLPHRGVDAAPAREEDPRDPRAGERRADVPAGAVGPAGSGAAAGDDDELARELALTLVDLLAEYGGPDATARGPGAGAGPPSRSAEARTSLVRASPVPTSNGHGPAPLDHRPADRPARPEASVPPARRADDSGAKLADLLAEAMDAFRRTGQDPATPGAPPVDDVRPVRR